MKKKAYFFIVVLLFVLFSLSWIAADGDLLRISVIDVGHGDSILVRTPGGYVMLIDAGPAEAEKKVIKYLHANNVKVIDVLVVTHPHQDHIGGMAKVIKKFKIGQVFMSNVSTNTKSCKDLLWAVKAEGIMINTSKADIQIHLDPALKVEMLAPNRSEYEDLNDYSAVIKINYKKRSFLFMGDACKVSEKEMLKAGFDLKADVLKVGHHGSDFATSPDFIKAVMPTYAIISEATVNDNRSPSKETLKRLKKKDIKIFRTDRNGTVLIESDGDTLAIKTEH